MLIIGGNSMDIKSKFSCRLHNKSLHPIWSVGPAFAGCSRGAANAGPPAQTGELNRYI